MEMDERRLRYTILTRSNRLTGLTVKSSLSHACRDRHTWDGQRKHALVGSWTQLSRPIRRRWNRSACHYDAYCHLVGSTYRHHHRVSPLCQTWWEH